MRHIVSRDANPSRQTATGGVASVMKSEAAAAGSTTAGATTGPVDAVGAADAAGDGATVVVPTYNERATVEPFLDRVLAAFDGAVEVVVVDDDSPDGTGAFVRESYADDRRVRVVSRPDERGIAGAVATGLARADTPIAAVADADFQHPPEALPRLVETVREGAQVAVGSRYVEGGAVDGWSLGRRLVSHGARLLAKAGVPAARGLADPLSGLFALRTDVIGDADLPGPRAGCKILLDVLRYGSYDGDRVVEVPYRFGERAGGESSFTPAVCTQFLAHLLALRSTARPDSAPPDGDGVALVSPYPPTNDGIADYARRLVDGYADAGEDVVVVASGRDEGARAGPEHASDGVTVDRRWGKDSFGSLAGVVAGLWAHRARYDVVHFNLKPTAFGAGNVLRFLSLLLPLVARLLVRRPVVVTTHDVVEGLDTDHVPERIGPIQRLGATLAMGALLLAGPVTVTSARYREQLSAKYPLGEVRHVPHGLPRGRPSPVEAEPFRVLLFGYVSPYKDYETVFEAVHRLRASHPDVQLWVVGGPHPDHPGLSERLRERYADRPEVRFTGRVDDERVPDVFAAASVLVLPYETAPGVSGPYQHARAHGRPVVAYDRASVRAATTGTGGDALAVAPGDAAALAATLDDLRANPDRLDALAANNAAAGGPTMADVAREIRAIAEEGRDG
jgi:dolichol-phosphate mannosyltransferase